MAKAPQNRDIEGDPKSGDAILKRMLQTKPKTHDAMVAERHKDARRGKKLRRASSRQSSKDS